MDASILQIPVLGVLELLVILLVVGMLVAVGVVVAVVVLGFAGGFSALAIGASSGSDDEDEGPEGDVADEGVSGDGNVVDPDATVE